MVELLQTEGSFIHRVKAACDPFLFLAVTELLHQPKLELESETGSERAIEGVLSAALIIAVTNTWW